VDAKVVLLVVIGQAGFNVVRLPDDTSFPAITVEQQMANPKLGLVTASDALSDLAQAMNEAVKEATGCSQDAFAVIEQ
jgi:endonuclease V-like protein UPF0215 family